MVNIKTNILLKEIVSSYVNPYQWRDFDIRSICNLRHAHNQFDLLEKWRET
jgi:hypothetical protein